MKDKVITQMDIIETKEKTFDISKLFKKDNRGKLTFKADQLVLMKIPGDLVVLRQHGNVNQEEVLESLRCLLKCVTSEDRG